LKYKILLMLVLICAVFVSLTIGSLSNYTAVSSFGTSITVDSDKIRQQAEIQRDGKQPKLEQKVQTTGDLQKE
jgi:P pilus assembly chaperone PapD